MNRRSALTALAGALGGAAAPAGNHAATASPSGVIAWGPEGCWVDAGGGVLHRLSDPLTRGLEPVPTADGLWLVTAEGMLRRWGLSGGLSWQPGRTVEFGAAVHALAATPDGRWALAAHGEQLSLLDRHGERVKTFDGTDLTREHRGPATALFALPQRRSFVAAWPALGELWEISLDPDAAPIFDGWVHDYRMSEGIAKPGYLGVRRSPLGRPMPSFSYADARVPWLAGAQGSEVIVAHLDVRRRIASLHAEGAKPAGATLRSAPRGRSAYEWWLPAGDEVHVFDTARWVRVAAHTLPGPVRQLQAADGAVWALAGERRAASLFTLRDGHAGAWLRVSGVAGPLVAARGDPRGSHVLALQVDPSALLLFDAGGDGGVLRAWPLPRDTDFHGAGWLPVT